MLPDHDPGAVNGPGFPSDPEKLVQAYLPLVRSVIKPYLNHGVPEEDLRQEGLIGLLEAQRRFDPSRGGKFSTYAHYWIRKQVLAALGAEGKHSAGERSEEELLRIPAPEQASPDQELRLPADLPPAERQVILLSYRRGLSLREISRELKLSPERVKQLRAKALRRIRGLVVSGEW
jgi:RNA polymerase sigma factor (sigma-70 family)